MLVNRRTARTWPVNRPGCISKNTAALKENSHGKRKNQSCTKLPTRAALLTWIKIFTARRELQLSMVMQLLLQLMTTWDGRPAGSGTRTDGKGGATDDDDDETEHLVRCRHLLWHSEVRHSIAFFYILVFSSFFCLCLPTLIKVYFNLLLLFFAFGAAAWLAVFTLASAAFR